MRRSFGLLSILVMALPLLLGAAGPVSAGEQVPEPHLLKGKGDHCVEPTGYMRRYHMQLLKHQRNDTVYQGIRDTKYSFKKCIECHAVPDPSGKNPNERNVKHFCFECHKYAAVWIDCFQCHASKLPEKEGATPAAGDGGK